MEWAQVEATLEEERLLHSQGAAEARVAIETGSDAMAARWWRE